LISAQDQTFCIKCGNLRVFSRQWKDKFNGKGSVITHTESVCPDVECQKIVDAKFAELREHKVASEERRKSAALLKKTEREARLAGSS